MLQHLRIRNFALIEETEVDFDKGLTVITGETGAGKSILLGALGLTLGNRADVASLNDKTKKCIIEAKFNINNYNLGGFFELNELDFDNVTTIRREITPEGKSRAFINDTPITLTVLKELGEKLIDVHSQHETLLMKETNFQLQLIDAFANTTSLVSDYKKQFTVLQKLKKQFDSLIAEETQAKKDLDYFQFQFNELEESEVKSGILKELEDESETLENAEFIKSALAKSSVLISGGEENSILALTTVKQQLQSVSKFNQKFNGYLERINSVIIELKELATDINVAEEDVVYDNSRLEDVNFKLDKLNRLLKKHGVAREEDLLIIKNDIEEKLQKFSSVEHAIEKIKKEISSQEKQCAALATELSKKRKGCSNSIEQKIKGMLNSLSMENARFKIELNATSQLTTNGFDAVVFLFAANKGSDLKELHKTASGGELSRLTLCLKALLAENTALPTIIFDEIDTGVSGEVADKIGNILKLMGNTMQVITITHLPQLASKGKNHLFVFKTDTSAKTTSNIRLLNNQERIAEIAKMLSSGIPTETALKNAKELLNA